MRAISLVVAVCLPAFALADPPKVGDTVWAQWKPNAWFHGKIGKSADLGFHVAFDDGDEAAVPPALVAVDKAAKQSDLKPGMRIVVPSDGGTLQAATVVKVDGDKVQCKHENLTDATVELKDVRVIAVRSAAAKTAKVGDIVWAQWRPNAWYHGKVAKNAEAGLHIVFDDGDEADLSVAVVAIDKAPAKQAVKTGSRVLAKWTSGDFYPGTIAGSADGKYKIKFDDGDEGEAAIDELRLLNE